MSLSESKTIGCKFCMADKSEVPFRVAGLKIAVGTDGMSSVTGSKSVCSD